MSSTLFQNLLLPNGVAYEQPLGLFIDNVFVLPAEPSLIAVENPATGKDIISVHAASRIDVNKAVAAARQAFRGEWRSLSATDRGSLLFKLADLIHRDQKLIAAIDSMDNGKTYNEALTIDLDEAYNVFKYYAGWADKIYGRTIEIAPSKLAYTLQEPLGVCGQIIPWNYPFMMLAWKVAPALACGNTVVLKSAEQTPLSALYFGKLVQEAGFPKGVVNIISGLGSIAGSALAMHMDVDKIAFTGSTATGRLIMKAATSNLKNITLECGGKSPSIVFEDAKLEQAVKWSHAGIMGNQGQVCTSTSRIYVQESIYDKFVELFVKLTQESAKLGDPFAEETIQGPQVSAAQLDKILQYIEEGKREGAHLATGGVRHSSEGYFIEPTVFTNTHEEMKIVKEEIFGPVVTISKFSDAADALKKANDTSYGLAAAVFTSDIENGLAIASKVEAGMVWINSSNDSHFGIPFGGYKSSGIGRELGPYALDAYTQTKAVHVNLGNTL
ncbi:hypothetical protein V501_02234 [Pseudogymnoascus sp. VKM F-4519 (FW-2642)]|nr:hypothetical protein V501_02234 [Pseudogymnoascus sp. VKM F-4519 (FW-2642)]